MCNQIKTVSFFRIVFVIATLLFASCVDQKIVTEDESISAQKIGNDVRKNDRQKATQTANVIYKLIQNEEYLKAYKLMSKSEDPYRMFSQFYSFSGRRIESFTGKPDRTCKNQPEDYKTQALEEILELAKSSKIVIVNEAHNQPYHRFIILKLMKELNKDGFNLYAAEAFNNTNATIENWNASNRSRGFLTSDDGFYTREPVFSQLVQEAISLGYKLIPYDYSPSTNEYTTRAERIKARELGQVKNLVPHITKMSINQRMIIHVGYSHAFEKPDNRGNKWMAQFLKEKTGIDPLTVSTNNCFLASSKFNDSVITLGENTDLDMYSLQQEYRYSRPTWLNDIGRKFIDLPKTMREEKSTQLIEAVKMNSPNESFIEDRILVRPGEKVTLALRPGFYEIRSVDEEKNIILSETIEVH